MLHEQAALLAEAARVDAEQDLRQALARFEFARESLAIAQTSLLEPALKAAQFTEEARMLGSATELDLMRAQADELAVQQKMMAMRLEFALAASALERTLGRPLLSAEPPTDS